jgi:hypothetical protein
LMSPTKKYSMYDTIKLDWSERGVDAALRVVAELTSFLYLWLSWIWHIPFAPVGGLPIRRLSNSPHFGFQCSDTKWVKKCMKGYKVNLKKGGGRLNLVHGQRRKEQQGVMTGQEATSA